MSARELKALLQSGGAGGHASEDKSDGSYWTFDQKMNGNNDPAKELVTPTTTINGNRLINVKDLLASTSSLCNSSGGSSSSTTTEAALNDFAEYLQEISLI